MDSLLLDLESSLKHLSTIDDAYRLALDNFSIIKSTIEEKGGACTVPMLIRVTLDTLERVIKYEGESLKIITGLIVLLRKLIEILDINLLGINYASVSRYIIYELVSLMKKLVESTFLGCMRHLIISLRHICSIVNEMKLSTDLIISLIDIFMNQNINDRNNEIEICILETISLTQSNTTLILNVQKYLINILLNNDKKYIESTGDLVSIHKVQMKKLSKLFRRLIHIFDEKQQYEFISVLTLYTTTSQYKFLACTSLECISIILKRVPEEESCKSTYLLAIFALKSLLNLPLPSTIDMLLLSRYLETCGNCLTCIVSEITCINNLEIQICDLIDNLAYRMQQCINSIDSSVHLTIVKSAGTILTTAQKAVLNFLKNSANTHVNLALFQHLLSRLEPLCSTMLEDYKCKVSWPPALVLASKLIDKWDEITLNSLKGFADIIDKLESARDEATTLLFPNLISRVLNMASVALAGNETTEMSSIIYSDVFPCRNELRCCVGAFIRAFGPSRILNLKPINFDCTLLSDPLFGIKTNSWLLPLLRVHTTRTHLSFFLNEFLPIALKLDTLSIKLVDSEPTHSRLYRILEEQIWSLLPGYFDEVVDLPQVLLDAKYTTNLRVYMVQLLDRNVTRDYVCNALTKLCKQTLIGKKLNSSQLNEINDAKKTLMNDQREYIVIQSIWKQNIPVLSHDVQTFLALMVVKFLALHKSDIENTQPSTVKEQAAQHYLNCIQSMVPLCPNEILEDNICNFNRVWEKLAIGVDSSQLPVRSSEIIALVDVATVMITRLPIKIVLELISTFARLLNILMNKGETKKCKSNCTNQLHRKLYKGLREGLEILILSEDEMIVKSMDWITQVWKTTSQDTETCPPNALKHRLGYLRKFVNFLKVTSSEKDFKLLYNFDKTELIHTLIPEILFCMCELNVGVRTNALALLKAIIECFIDDSDMLQNIIITIISASGVRSYNLGNHGYMKIACLIALSRVIFDYGDIFKLFKISGVYNVHEKPESCITLVSNDFESHQYKVSDDATSTSIVSNNSCRPFETKTSALTFSGNLESGVSLLETIMDVCIVNLCDLDSSVYLQALKFVKVCIHVLDQQQLNKFVGKFVPLILDNNHNTLKHRVNVRRLLLKLIKKLGSEVTLVAFPSKHHALHRYLVRHLRRQKIKKRHKTNDGSLSKDEEDFEAIMQGRRTKDEETDDEQDYNTEYSEGHESSTNKKITTHVDRNVLVPPSISGLLEVFEMDDENYNSLDIRNTSKRKSEDLSLTILEDSTGPDDCPLDLLSSKASQKIILQRKRQNTCKSEDLEHMDDSISFDNFGKIVIKKANKEINSFNLDIPRDSVQYIEPNKIENTKQDTQWVSALKQRRQAKFEQAKKRKQHILIKSAKDFKSKKGGGDISKNGLQPFAYMRLNPALYKEEHRLQATKSISNLVSKGIYKKVTSRRRAY
ncbi:uncharacterized protein CMU_023940 [Cryptosporidium muris RN66]|uniref:RRP12 HEAT domain-containing protein n=1 Tax=Cryptosporidium muris (strain RN66) TaxID=441375 RepID=B6AC36_CRYMR|nr:uncharacterized protein CMU_023940 [Cryptosporidium muris RN66]EEA05389.1 hypothetical protein, conserved [Cryptosporidium muris RN66]|eukprot:XP_002139738.1 hypothetical protein [Cryptosporidium muris RN66]